MKSGKALILLLIFTPICLIAQLDTIILNYEKSNYEKLAKDSTFVWYNFTTEVSNLSKKENFENYYTTIFLNRFFDYDQLKIKSIPYFHLNNDYDTIYGSELVSLIDFKNSPTNQTFLIYTDSLYNLPKNYPPKYFSSKIKLTSEQRHLEFIWSTPKAAHFKITSTIKDSTFWEENERFLKHRETILGSGYVLNDYIVNNTNNHFFYLKKIGMIMVEYGEVFLLHFNENYKFQITPLKEIYFIKGDNWSYQISNRKGNSNLENQKYFLKVNQI